MSNELALEIERASMRLQRMVEDEVERVLRVCVRDRGMSIMELSLESEDMRPMLTRVKRGAETVVTVEAKLWPDAKRYTLSTVWS